MNKQSVSPVDRSLLFVPGHRPERFDKAAASGAHNVVLDLEDAVSPEAKDDARQKIAAWLSAGGTAMVRINAADTPWYADDIRMLQAFPSTGVMLPKACKESLVCAINELSRRSVIALLETVRGYMHLRELCAVSGLERIAFGSLDFSAESGIADEGDTLTVVRSTIVLESVYAGLKAPIDGISTEFTDLDRMHSDALRAKQLGFGGKLCIHPRQVSVVNEAFVPAPAEYEWAQRVITAFQQSKGAVTTVDGKMIDKPVVDHAQRIIDEFTMRGSQN